VEVLLDLTVDHREKAKMDHLSLALVDRLQHREGSFDACASPKMAMTTTKEQLEAMDVDGVVHTLAVGQKR
jgi:hypothetical protein